MMYLGDQPFRMPDSWYDPPEPEPWTCTECGHRNNEGDECDECGVSEDGHALDPYEAYQDYLADRADEMREEAMFPDD